MIFPLSSAGYNRPINFNVLISASKILKVSLNKKTYISNKNYANATFI